MELPQLSRVFTAIKHVERAPEVLRCIQGCRDWPRVVPAYLGLRKMKLPARVTTRGGAAFDFEEFYDIETMWQIYCRGVYDVRRTDRIIVDAGANIGLFACFAAKAAPQSIIHAIEPMPATYERLVRTVRQNSLDDRIRCHSEALSSHRGHAAMAAASASQMAHVVEGAGPSNGVAVATTTLADLVDRIDAPVIDLLKMDIEGSEYDVLHSTASSTLRRFRRIVVEYHKPARSSGWNKQTLARHVTTAGFRLAEDPEDAEPYGIFHFTQPPLVS